MLGATGINQIPNLRSQGQVEGTYGIYKETRHSNDLEILSKQKIAAMI